MRLIFLRGKKKEPHGSSLSKHARRSSKSLVEPGVGAAPPIQLRLGSAMASPSLRILPPQGGKESLGAHFQIALPDPGNPSPSHIALTLSTTA